jgi:hypothetical protein
MSPTMNCSPADPTGERAELRQLRAASAERDRELQQFLVDAGGEIAKLAAIRSWLATYPDIPEDVTGDPEAMIVVRLRRILGDQL